MWDIGSDKWGNSQLKSQKSHYVANLKDGQAMFIFCALPELFAWKV
jgi:hypothetical protein